jgi:hypothetical protein
MDYDQSGIATTYDEARALTPATLSNGVQRRTLPSGPNANLAFSREGDERDPRDAAASGDECAHSYRCVS